MLTRHPVFVLTLLVLTGAALAAPESEKAPKPVSSASDAAPEVRLPRVEVVPRPPGGKKGTWQGKTLAAAIPASSIKRILCDRTYKSIDHDALFAHAFRSNKPIKICGLGANEITSASYLVFTSDEKVSFWFFVSKGGQASPSALLICEDEQSARLDFEPFPVSKSAR